MKKPADADYIASLIAQGEHQTQDFKYEISDISKIAKTLSAFANTDGGRLLIGVKDNGRIAGSSVEEEAYMIEAAATLYCRPAVGFRVEAFRVNGKSVLVAEIEKSTHPPVYAKDREGKEWAYLRINDENILATSLHLRIWKQAHNPTGELLSFTRREKQLLDRFTESSPLSLSRCRHHLGISKWGTEKLLAQLIGFGIIEPVFIDHRFYFRLVAGNS